MHEINPKPTNNTRQCEGAPRPCRNHGFVNEMGSKVLSEEDNKELSLIRVQTLLKRLIEVGLKFTVLAVWL